MQMSTTRTREFSCSRAALILLTTAAAGCAVSYEKPDEGPSAEFTFINRTDVIAHIEIKRVEDCGIRGVHWRSLESVGKKSYAGQETMTAQVEARGPFAIRIGTYKREHNGAYPVETRCSVEAAFELMPQHQYEAELKLQGGYCVVEMRRLDRKGDAIFRTPQRVYSMPDKCRPSLQR